MAIIYCKKDKKNRFHNDNRQIPLKAKASFPYSTNTKNRPHYSNLLPSNITIPPTADKTDLFQPN